MIALRADASTQVNLTNEGDNRKTNCGDLVDKDTSYDAEFFQRTRQTETTDVQPVTPTEPGTLEVESTDVEELGETPYTGYAKMDGETTVYLVQALVRTIS